MGTTTMHALYTLETSLALSSKLAATSLTTHIPEMFRWVRSTDTQQYKQKHSCQYSRDTPIPLSMAIQKICCFSNETEVNEVSYTCGGYHCACSAHIRQTSHSMLLVLLNVQEDADTLWLHCYLCLLMIQEGPCCFGDETGTLVRYTCGHSHYACSAHIRHTSCAQCRGSGHKHDSKHTDKYAVSEIHWYTTAQTEAQVAIPTSNTHTVVYYYTGNLLLLQ